MQLVAARSRSGCGVTWLATHIASIVAYDVHGTCVKSARRMGQVLNQTTNKEFKKQLGGGSCFGELSLVKSNGTYTLA